MPKASLIALLLGAVVLLTEIGVVPPGWRDLAFDLWETSSRSASPTGPNQPTSGREGAEGAAVAAALRQLPRIRVENEYAKGYSREDWPHWVDEDGDCINARHEVLLSESERAVEYSPDGCRILTGLWHDRFTGQVFLQAEDLDVDHLVPLAEAHRSGGFRWDRTVRAAFANDLDDPRSLIAVGASVNRSKGDKGPEDWLPPEPIFVCEYVANWVLVKARWNLSMDERERVAVANILEDCGPSS
ncbi:hypothetical protein FHS00_003537 [Limimaricola variabilis]|uniref:GmrSD restriction endonucleases C-terminal domain-containing protein n=1 Tax=Limimaricola variabilis TaxID=1492771 RepID=A0ABR6HU76_9RHOB|nr:hypothetical protein [Limimaricola variabilis]